MGFEPTFAAPITGSGVETHLGYIYINILKTNKITTEGLEPSLLEREVGLEPTFSSITLL